MSKLFSPFTLKDVTLRNRIAMSPMTMYRSTDGKMDDFHVMYLGARAAGGFGMVFPEQVAITPDGRTTTSCAGIYDDDQIEGHARVTRIIRDMGAVAAIQLGHTGRKGSLVKPWEGGHMLPPEHELGWQTRGPSAIPYGDDMPYAPTELSREEIAQLMVDYASAARRAVDAGCTHAVVEMTSEGALQYRHKGVALDALVFTNLQPEHLERHGGFDAYASAKLSLAKHLEGSPKRPRVIVANTDDAYGKKFSQPEN